MLTDFNDSTKHLATIEHSDRFPKCLVDTSSEKRIDNLHHYLKSENTQLARLGYMEDVSRAGLDPLIRCIIDPVTDCDMVSRIGYGFGVRPACVQVIL